MFIYIYTYIYICILIHLKNGLKFAKNEINYKKKL